MALGRHARYALRNESAHASIGRAPHATTPRGSLAAMLYNHCMPTAGCTRPTDVAAIDGLTKPVSSFPCIQYAVKRLALEAAGRFWSVLPMKFSRRQNGGATYF